MSECDECAIVNGLALEIRNRWPHLSQNVKHCNHAEAPNRHNIMIALPDSCFNRYIHIVCADRIYGGVDSGFGPTIKTEYHDPNCIINIMNFIGMILSNVMPMKRKFKSHGY